MSELEQPVRLYVEIPATTGDAVLTELLAAGDIACVAVVGADEAAALRLMAIVRQADRAFLLVDDAPLAKKIGADGVHLTSVTAYGSARTLLTSDAIIGVATAASRHEAMEAAESGADYVAIAPAPDLVGFWVTAMTVPCVVWGIDTPQAAAAMVEAQADFIALSGPMLTPEAVRSVQALIDAG